MTKLEKRLQQARRTLTRESLQAFGKGIFDGYRLISDDGTWCLEPILESQGVGIYHTTKHL